MFREAEEGVLTSWVKKCISLLPVANAGLSVICQSPSLCCAKILPLVNMNSCHIALNHLAQKKKVEWNKLCVMYLTWGSILASKLQWIASAEKVIRWIRISPEEKCSDVGLCVLVILLICNFCVDVHFAHEQCINTDLWSDQRNYDEFWFTDHVTWKSHLHAFLRLLNFIQYFQSNHNLCQVNSYVNW